MGRISAELWTPFVDQWREAASAGLSPEELAQLLGMHLNTLRSRQIALRQRGIMLPLLRGQRGPTGPRSKQKTRVIESVGVAPKCSVESMVIYVM